MSDSGGHPPEGQVLPVLDEAMAIAEQVDVALSPEYDAAVDVVEDHWIQSAMKAMQMGRIEDASALASRAEELRSRYLRLLGNDEELPWPEARWTTRELRDFALRQASVTSFIQTMLSALTEYRRGEPQAALATITRLAEAPRDLSEVADTAMSKLFKAQAEQLVGFIRASVGDHAGSRAAFARAAALVEALIEGDPEREFPPEIRVLPRWFTSQALVARARLSDQSNDHQDAADAYAGAAAELEEGMGIFSEWSPTYYAPIYNASTLEVQSLQAAALAQAAIERGDWPHAESYARRAQSRLEAASRAVLQSEAAIAQYMQESYLNKSFQYGASIRRQLERERLHQRQVEDLRDELRELHVALASALAPSGVVVNANNTAEVVNSVHQQVELVARVEANARSLLRDISSELSQSGIDNPRISGLQQEAAALSAANESGPGFFARLQDFVHRASGIAADVGGSISTILATLRALSIPV